MSCDGGHGCDCNSGIPGSGDRWPTYLVIILIGCFIGIFDDTIATLFILLGCYLAWMW